MEKMLTWKAMVLILLFAVFASSSHAMQVSEVRMDAEIHLSAGLEELVFCNGTFDGYVTAASAVLYDYYSSQQAAPDNDTDHYTNASCTLTETNQSVCSFRVRYFANPSMWICNISVTDGNIIENNWTNTTVEPLSAMSITSITFHNYSVNMIFPGTISSEETMQIENTGNVNLTVEISAQAESISCSTGAIPIANSHYSIIEATPYNESIQLSTSPAPIGNYILPKRTGPVQENRSIFWRLLVPTGVGGECEGEIYLRATG
jgi:hypothetical protein